MWRWLRRRRWREHRQVLLELNRSLLLIVDPHALMASIVARTNELFGTDRIIILRAFDEVGIFTVIFSTGFSPQELKTISLSQKDRLARWLLTNEVPLVVTLSHDVFNFLGAEEREMLIRLDIRVCAPLLAVNRLTGVVFLSTSKKEWHLGKDDTSLLQMIMGQASIAFENAYLYQQQRDRLRKLYRAEKLATAGQLAASVAHEIRNPLTTIRSTAQYLLEEFDENNPKRELMEGMIEEVRRIDQTVDGLLKLTRQTEFNPQRIDFKQLVEQSLAMVRAQAHNQSVEVVVPESNRDIYILGDVSQLKQLILNLTLNALQAMPDGGRLEISFNTGTELRAMGNEKLWAYVSIIDTGHGIPADLLDKIFDPFFTTKHGGTGLGLSTSYAIVRQHGGELEITSSKDKGTTATLKFPLVE